jgi:hypothetical protein
MLAVSAASATGRDVERAGTQGSGPPPVERSWGNLVRRSTAAALVQG